MRRIILAIAAATAVASQASASEYSDCKTRVLISAGGALVSQSMHRYLGAINKQGECNKLIAKLPPDEQKKVIEFNNNIDREQRRNLWLHGNL